MRYGYFAFCYLQQLCSKKMVKGLPKINFSTGECLIGSVDMHPEENLHKGKSSRAPVSLQMVHMVLGGPFAETSVSHGRYILTFVDDFSRFTWVYFLHRKNEVLDKFPAFKTHVEQKLRKAIKVLRMDNESRYVNKRLIEFCTLEGIDLQNPPIFSSHKIYVVALRT